MGNSDRRKPRVTVVMPTYNRAEMIGDALDSTLAQTVPVDEIIVVDDGSTDKTSEKLKKYTDRVRILTQSNAGPAAARNFGLREASGDLIALQDSDDLWLPEKNAQQLEYLDQHPEIDFLFSDNKTSRRGQVVSESSITDLKCKTYLKRNSADLSQLFNWLLIENPIATSSVIFRAERIKQVGYFNEQLFSVEDRDYWLRWARSLHFAYLDYVLVERRFHSTNIVADCELGASSLVKVIESWRDRLPVDDSPGCSDYFRRGLGGAYFNLGSYYFRVGARAKAWPYFKRSLSLHPWQPKCFVKLIISTPDRFF